MGDKEDSYVFHECPKNAATQQIASFFPLFLFTDTYRKSQGGSDLLGIKLSLFPGPEQN